MARQWVKVTMTDTRMPATAHLEQVTIGWPASLVSKVEVDLVWNEVTPHRISEAGRPNGY